MRAARWILVGGLLSVAMLCGPAAEACMHGMEVKTDPVAIGVAEAERIVNGEHPESAAGRLRQADGALATAPVGQSGMSDRAKRVLARVAARTEGRARLGIAAEDGPTEGIEMRRLAFMAQTLKDLAAKRPADDPTLRTDLGEVLAELPEGKAEAKELLSNLERADVMSSAHGYASLARLRHEEGKRGAAIFKSALTAQNHGRIAVELSRCSGLTKLEGVCSIDGRRGRELKSVPFFAAPRALVGKGGALQLERT